MTLGLTFAAFLVGALWRCWLGGAWGPSYRWPHMLALFALCWPVWALPIPWEWRAVSHEHLFGLLCLWLLVGHNFGNCGRDALRRYGPFGLGYVIAYRFRRNLPCEWTQAGEAWLGGSTLAAVTAVLRGVS